ncbi:ABC transporter substrate-binding protein [Actinocorallia sp. API 0066]|uniref:ABC transporter substrate-binding protein n=1 Tax=Actinocorallia sp. API 0066 TaxID=2896846 RepID=UPI001E4EE89C|nr:ABC transporter substrate-binding protein [Actinocorallia sp. API 0066]MCD0449480.1 ABC transporter substrate-binding protein [Actinocorallia sp. API 0066]
MTTHVRVLLEYLHPWTNSGGLFVAAAQGWFRDAGLDVELSSADPSRGDSLAYLARGEASFAVFPANRLFVRRARGERLTGVAAVNHRAMETLRTYAGSGIERPRDLEGRRVAYNPTPRGTAMVRHLVAADGGDPDAVVTVDSGLRELGVADLESGAADATFGNYWAWDVLFGEPGVYWPVDTIGAPSFHSYLLGAADTTLERDPELVRAFLAAAGRGYLAAVESPELALDAFERYIPYFPRPLLERSLTLISGTWTHEGRWGVQRPDLHAPYAAWLAASGVLPDGGVWREATTNAYLEAA